MNIKFKDKFTLKILEIAIFKKFYSPNSLIPLRFLHNIQRVVDDFRINDDVYDIPPWELSYPTVILTLHSSSKSETHTLEYRQHF